jgi:hypothetical protein
MTSVLYGSFPPLENYHNLQNFEGLCSLNMQQQQQQFHLSARKRRLEHEELPDPKRLETDMSLLSLNPAQPSRSFYNDHAAPKGMEDVEAESKHRVFITDLEEELKSIHSQEIILKRDDNVIYLPDHIKLSMMAQDADILRALSVQYASAFPEPNDQNALVLWSPDPLQNLKHALRTSAQVSEQQDSQSMDIITN